MRALFVEHDHLSPQGPVAERFEQRGYSVEERVVVPPERYHTPNQPHVFPDPADYDALVVMGAPWGAWDDASIGSWLLPEIDWLRRADAAGIPVLGICFGGQLLARTHGGSVGRAPRPEIGWSLIWSDDPTLVGPGPWFQWHFDRWVVPPDAHEVARNALASQAFTLRRNLAVQFHPELAADGLRGWLDQGGRDELIADGQDPDVLLAHTREEAPAAAERAHRLVDAFIDRVASR